MTSYWSKSCVQEIIAIAWLIASILCFGFGFIFSGYCMLFPAITCLISSIYHGYKEAMK